MTAYQKVEILRENLTSLLATIGRLEDLEVDDAST